MRIISKFHDYYDSAMGFGHDDSVVYARKEETVCKDHRAPDELGFMCPAMTKDVVRTKGWVGLPNVTLKPFIVGFCGVLYPGIRAVGDLSRRDNQNKIDECVYELDGYVSLCDTLGLTLEGTKSAYFLYDHLDEMPSLERFFNLRGVGSYRDRLAESKSPLVLSVASDRNGQCTITKNARLMDWQFYRVFDAYSAFQELDMFLSGVMSNEDNPMGGVDDKDLAKQKGFDCYSFKKAPTKRSRKACRK